MLSRKTDRTFVLIVNYMKSTKNFKEVKPGRATWKFQLGERLIYRVKNYDALKLYWELRDRKPFIVYVRTQQGWEYVATHEPSEYCICGRAYDDTPNGESFRFQEHPLEWTIDAMTVTMKSPVLCQLCYYRGELKAGRWAPKHVQKQLGLET